MKFELFKGINNCNIIYGNINSKIDTTKKALNLLQRQTQFKDKCVILSDISEHNETLSSYHQELKSLLNDSVATKIIGIGNKSTNILSNSKIEHYIFDSTQSFLNSRTIKNIKDTTILLAGSESFEFEKIKTFLEEDTYKTTLEVNLDSLISNLDYFRTYLKPETKMLVMVKAFSYGSGSYEIANFLEYQKVDYLGVASAEEGVALRKAGVKLPIIVMSAAESSFQRIIDYNLEPEIFNITTMLRFNKFLDLPGESSYPIHIKIDTGMKRLGFDISELDKLIDTLQVCKNLKPISVFSHMVGSSEPKIFNDFSLKQISDFTEAAAKLQSNYKHKLIRHILNSSGIEHYPQAQFEMVRLGIGFHGISVKNRVKLQEISTLKTSILQIRNVKKHETVGYSRQGTVLKNSKIAVLPIGYADGLKRRFGNGVGEVLINGSLVPIVGNICMDMCMVNVTNIDANEGDEVIIFGEKPNINDLAEKIGTIPYEILTSVAQRVKRVYITSGC